MRITILLLIMSEEQEFLCKYLIFQKFDLKFKKNIFLNNIALFSSRECQTFSSYMRIIILLLIMKEEQAFLCKYVIFRKFSLKFLKIIFLKISLHFLVENVKPFHLICELLFYC